MPKFTHGSSACIHGKYFFDFGIPDYSEDFSRWYTEVMQQDPQAVPPAGSVPTRGIQQNRSKGKFDVIYFGGLLTVSEELKALIEGFEPGLHQFYPIEFIDRQGNKFSKDYYWLRIGAYLDATIIEKSSISMKPNAFANGAIFPYYDYYGEDYRTVKRDIVTGHHLWIDAMFPIDGHLYFSDDLYGEYMKRKMTGIPRFYQANIE